MISAQVIRRIKSGFVTSQELEESFWNATPDKSPYFRHSAKLAVQGCLRRLIKKGYPIIRTEEGYLWGGREETKDLHK